MMKRIQTFSILAALLQFAYGGLLSDEEINQKFIKIERRHPTESHVRSKRAADRGAQNVYYLSKSAVTWGDAWFTCTQGMNGKLLSIETLEKDEFIRDFLFKHGKTYGFVWTSGAYDTTLGIWRWLSNGGQANYLNFLPGHPTNNGTTLRIVFENSLFFYGWRIADISSGCSCICEQSGDPVPQPTPAP